MAHPYDFRSLRYILAGAEPVKETTRRIYMEKFGLRILEGYGVTETAPALALNTPMFNRFGTVGRILPGMEARLEKVEGVEEGGRLYVRGPNVMLGYLKVDNPGVLERPAEGWHDTGDIVTIDEQGFITIKGRARRFAKVGGEMMSLAAVEALASDLWPNALSAVVAVPDPRKGERLILLTQQKDATRAEFQSFAKDEACLRSDDSRRGVGARQAPRPRHRQGRHDGGGQARRGAACREAGHHGARKRMTGSDLLPPRLKPILEAEYPRFSAAEMARRRAAVEAALAEAQCDHLVFYGANRAGSAVQWLTQWPVTVEAIGVLTPGERDALFVQWINHAPLAKRLATDADVAWGGESSIAAAIAVLEKRGARENRVAVIGPIGFPSMPRSPRGSARLPTSTAPMCGCGA